MWKEIEDDEGKENLMHFGVHRRSLSISHSLK